jgi:hypothetical protein
VILSVLFNSQNNLDSTKNLFAFLIVTTRATYSAHNTLFNLITTEKDTYFIIGLTFISYDQSVGILKLTKLTN